MDVFTGNAPLLGGIVIGLSAALLLFTTGRVAGISGITGGLLQRAPDGTGWRLAFVLGLVLGGGVLMLVAPATLGVTSAPLPLVATAGVLVGVGTRMGGGCTSGHGVCGISRMSTRSIVATGTFMLVGGLTTYAATHLIGGLP